MHKRSNKWVRQVQTQVHSPCGEQQAQAAGQRSVLPLETATHTSGTVVKQVLASGLAPTAPSAAAIGDTSQQQQQQQQQQRGINQLHSNTQAVKAGVERAAGAVAQGRAACNSCWQWTRQQAAPAVVGPATSATACVSGQRAADRVTQVLRVHRTGLPDPQQTRQYTAGQPRQLQRSAYRWQLAAAPVEPATAILSSAAATSEMRLSQALLRQQQHQQQVPLQLPEVSASAPAHAHLQVGTVAAAQHGTANYKRNKTNQLIRTKPDQLRCSTSAASTTNSHATKRFKVGHNSSPCQAATKPGAGAQPSVSDVMSNTYTRRTQHKLVRTQLVLARTPPPTVRGSKVFNWVRSTTVAGAQKLPGTPGYVVRAIRVMGGVCKPATKFAIASSARTHADKLRGQPQHKQLVRLGAVIYHVVRGPQGQRQLRAVPAASQAKAAIQPSTTLLKAKPSHGAGLSISTLTAADSSLPKLRFGRSWRNSLAASRLSKTLNRARNQARKHSTCKVPPCSTFCRTGACAELTNGRCRLEHDPRKVAVCMHWLQGNCTKPGCKMQHQVCKDLMPVCTFFLQGTCSTEDCPYLHVNYPEGTPVCRAFTRGFCPMGQRCTKQHTRLRRTAAASSKVKQA